MTERDDDIVSMLREDATPGTYGHALREAAAAEIERLRAAASLALRRLGELNRDDESGIRMVLANALKPDHEQSASGEVK